MANDDGWKVFKWLLATGVTLLLFGVSIFYGLIVYVYVAIGAVIPFGVYLAVGIQLERLLPRRVWLQELLSHLIAGIALFLILWGSWHYGDYILPEGAYITGGRGRTYTESQAEGGTITVWVGLLYLVIGLIVGAIKLSDLFSQLKQKLNRTKDAPKKGLPR